jgi:serine/threonine protein kinase
MGSPTTSSAFVELVRKSGVISEETLDAYLRRLGGTASVPNQPIELARCLVRDGVLTRFQAEQILLGKWRRFTFGKYTILDRLGAGGMGSVYLCEHRFMRRRVAVKVLPLDKADKPAALERFYREARAVASLDHPNIVRAFDIDEDDKLHFLVMEYIDGVNLQDLVSQRGPLAIDAAAHYARQAAAGLQHAFRIAGLVHRDIKPANILVNRQGVVKILDMGLARFFNDDEDLITKKYDEKVLGTTDYLAPEQILSSQVDIRADVYSLGATLYFLFTGSTPFGRGTATMKLIWHQVRMPKPVQTLRAEVPDGLAAIVGKMMAKDPRQRFQEPGDVVEALAAWAPGPAPVPADLPGTRSPQPASSSPGTSPLIVSRRRTSSESR